MRLSAASSFWIVAGLAPASCLVLMYADTVTDSMHRAIDETARRRRIQEEYNAAHGVTPTSIKKEIREGIEKYREAEEFVSQVVGERPAEHELKSYLTRLKERMELAARSLDFEHAARLRDKIRALENKEIKNQKSKGKSERQK